MSKIMTADQISELIAIARKDASLWQTLIDRELENEKRIADARKQGLQPDDRRVKIDPPKLPTTGMLIDELVERQYGKDHDFVTALLIIPFRRELRLDLGLPV